MHIIDEAIDVAVERARLIIETSQYSMYRADSWPFRAEHMTIFDACGVFMAFLESRPCWMREGL